MSGLIFQYCCHDVLLAGLQVALSSFSFTFFFFLWVLIIIFQEDGWGYGPLMSQTAHAAVAVSRLLSSPWLRFQSALRPLLLLVSYRFYTKPVSGRKLSNILLIWKICTRWPYAVVFRRYGLALKFLTSQAVLQVNCLRYCGICSWPLLIPLYSDYWSGLAPQTIPASLIANFSI